VEKDMQIRKHVICTCRTQLQIGCCARFWQAVVSRRRRVICGAAVGTTLDVLSMRGHGPKRQQEGDWFRHERDGG